MAPGFFHWCCLLAACAAAVGCSRKLDSQPGRNSQVAQLRFQPGDDPRWAATDFDDSGWRTMLGRELPSRSGIYWVRWRVTQKDFPAANVRDGILIKVVASYDLFWDGHLIGRNGEVGTNAREEKPGSVDALFQIPRERLGPGEHVVAMRMSSFHTGFRSPTYALNFDVQNFREVLLQRSRTAIFSVMAVGAALVVALVFGLMWLIAERRAALLLFSVLFGFVALMQALQAWRWLFEYPYSWHYPRLVTITALVSAMAALLPLFVMLHFRLGWRRWIIITLGVLLAAGWLAGSRYDIIGFHVCAVGFFTALALSLHAVIRRRRGAGYACGGLALSVIALLSAPRDFLDHAFFISAGPAVVGLLVALVLQLRDERREAQQAVLTAARLETELLKKNIQPHFLLNTLATIQEIIEQEPKTAVALIDALASEFRVLARVSGEKLISLEQELELCHAHLQVMSLRKGARCALTVAGVNREAGVPPALFHTLIENGLTHLTPRDNKLEFNLSAEQFSGGVRYTLLARGERQSSVSHGVGAGRSDPHAKEGTGIRYLKTRLEESFTGRWTMAGMPVPEGWRTVIEIRGTDVPSPGSREPVDPRALSVEKPA